MNNNITNMVNSISSLYGLTEQEVTAILIRYQNDSRPINIVENEIKSLASYYSHQHKLSNSIMNTPPLSNDNNYYIMTFDNKSNVVLEGVKVTVTNPDTKELLVNNTFKGYQKHTSVDDLEIALCQIGKLLNFDIVEEYYLYNQNKQKDSIIIKDLINGQEFYNVDNLKKRFQKLISNGKIKKEKWVDAYQNLTVASTEDDYKAAIDYGLKILKVLPSMLEDDYKQLETKYFDMLIFDSLINQSERKFEDYGILCNKETKRYTYAPLFDNVYPSILKNNDLFILNGIVCNRYKLIECLFTKYYEKIIDRIEYLLNNKEIILKSIDVIAKYNLNLSTYTMLMNNINTNINYMERLNNERKVQKQNQSAGYADIATMSVMLLIIVIFSVAIAYLLYCIK